MKAEIRNIYSPDIDSLEDFVPSIKDKFGFLLTIMAGPQNGDGEESFDVIVCTPKWLSENSKEDIIIGRHYLIMFNYDFQKLKSFIEKYCNTCTGSTWQECALKLSRLGHWEFEDYSETSFQINDTCF